jgi:hypothetical protein
MSNFPAISWREQVTFNEMVMSALYYTKTLKWIFIALALWNNSQWVDMSLHSDTLFSFRANPSLLFRSHETCQKCFSMCPQEVLLLFRAIRIPTWLPQSLICQDIFYYFSKTTSCLPWPVKTSVYQSQVQFSWIFKHFKTPRGTISCDISLLTWYSVVIKKSKMWTVCDIQTDTGHLFEQKKLKWAKNLQVRS